MFYLQINLKLTRMKMFTSRSLRQELAKIYKDEGRKVGEYWIRVFLPKHFTKAAFGRYNMVSRGHYYNFIKRVAKLAKSGWLTYHEASYRNSRLIRQPQVVPLVLTGQLQDRTRTLNASNVNVTAPWWGGRGNKDTNAEVKIVVPIPIGHPIHPNQASKNGPGSGEIVRTIASERRLLGEMFTLGVWRRLTSAQASQGRNVA